MIFSLHGNNETATIKSEKGITDFADGNNAKAYLSRWLLGHDNPLM